MEYQEAKRIYGEIESLFESRLVLIKGDFFENHSFPKVNYRNELKQIQEIKFSVEQHTNSLLHLYRQNPLVQHFILELFNLNSYCLQFTYQVHHEAKAYTVNARLKWNRHKMHYLFELFASFTKFDIFLRMYVLPISMGNVPGSTYNHLYQPPRTLVPNQPLPSQEDVDSELEKEVLGKLIALLDELEVIGHKKIRHLKQWEQRDIYRYLVGFSDRGIKGNVAMLDANSNENPSRYSSYLYKDWAKKVISGEIKLRLSRRRK